MYSHTRRPCTSSTLGWKFSAVCFQNKIDGKGAERERERSGRRVSIYEYETSVSSKEGLQGWTDAKRK
jgi:hypothetical protein